MSDSFKEHLGLPIEDSHGRQGSPATTKAPQEASKNTSCQTSNATNQTSSTTTKPPAPPAKPPAPPAKPPAPPAKPSGEESKSPPKSKPKPKPKPKGKPKKRPKGKPTEKSGKKRKRKGRKINIKLNLRQKKISNEEDTYSDQIGWTSMEESFDDIEDLTPKRAGDSYTSMFNVRLNNANTTPQKRKVQGNMCIS